MTISDEGKVEWKLTSSQIGSHIVEAIARDSQGATSTQSFTIEVGTTAINNAPTITSTSQEYDNLGRRVAAIDQEGKRTEYAYDDLGRLIGVKNALNYWTTYAYNSVGNLQM
jgi:YD repeat-containing protein